MEAHNEIRLRRMFDHSSTVTIQFVHEDAIDPFEEKFDNFEEARNRIDELDFDHVAYF